jgi:HPt (histidine-containing phosphotransfer) domain-containing protein
VQSVPARVWRRSPGLSLGTLTLIESVASYLAIAPELALCVPLATGDVCFLHENKNVNMSDIGAKAVDKQCFNYGELLERVDNDRDLMRELLEIFKKDFPRLREELQAAVVSGDLHRVQVIGHTLRGMFANLAASRASTLAAHLEQIGNSSEGTGLSEAFTALEAESMTLLPVLDSCREEVCR